MTVLAAAAAFAAQEPQVVNGVIVRPEWERIPTPEEMRRPAHTDWSPQGEVVLLCTVVNDGRIDDCKVQPPAPADQRVTAYAVGLTRFVRHNTRLQDGSSAIGLKVRIPIRLETTES
ncbi:hypothetical protein [Brevundimonas sp.]|uniref:hypothetical protein n=1 Tax=Brevundimonas sp. TaxID=1871086 RepID=UPI002D77BCE8|nr:hypothetical protein [Brevundimonas sp.]